ncbi:MAG: hypothetical protein J6M53_09550 [Bacteroidaceae bacterium]|nr:hypothetical protein [Bacteroidaceae bacterium]
MKKTLLLLTALLLALPMAAQRWGLIKDEGGQTNIRRGPGTNYAVVDKFPDGSMVYYLPSGTRGWHTVYTSYTDGSKQDIIGYVSASKVVTPPRKGEWKEVAFVIEEGGYTNIRRGAGTNYAIASKVKDGSYILCSSADLYNDKAWIRVYTQNATLRGYISRSKIMPLESPQF